MIRRRESNSDEDEEAPPLKSKRSRSYSFVRFNNETERDVDVVWVNYQGAGVYYKTLTPQQFLDVNTFVGHPWVFFDSKTGDRMVVQKRQIFEPSAWNASGETSPQRKSINITIPVFSLKDCCLKKLRSLVPFNKIGDLEIPETLKIELGRTVEMSRTYSTKRGMYSEGRDFHTTSNSAGSN